MPSDNVVNWKDERPSRQEIQQIIEDYFGAVLASIEWKQTQQRFYVCLVGDWSHPLARVGDEHARQMVAAIKPEGDLARRWIEVFIDREYVDVMVRMGDPFTSAAARHLAAQMANRWAGELEPI